MNIWKTLGIKKTTEKSLIKKAYREKLKKTRPDDDENAFMELRNAYEKALEYAEDNFEDEFYEADFLEKEDYEEEIYSSMEQDEYAQWNIRLLEVWNDLKKRYNPECWKELLYEDIPYKLGYYELCRERIKSLI